MPSRAPPEDSVNDQAKYWYSYALSLEHELARYRALPAVPVRDFFLGCALAGIVAGPTFCDPEEAASVAMDFANAVMRLREPPKAAEPTEAPISEEKAAP